MAIPKYLTLAGQIYQNSSLSIDSEHIFVIKTTMQEVESYINSLQHTGFVLHSQRKTPSSLPNRENIFYCCYKNDRAIVLFYDYSKQTCSIIEQPFASLPNVQNPITDSDGEVSLTQLQLVYGAGYVIKLKDNSFVIVDGGNYCEEDTQRLYDYLKTYSDKIKIRTWFFSHPDEDHITLATAFIKKYSQEIIIESFCYQFPDFDKVSMLIRTDKVVNNILQLETAIKTYCKSSKIITARTGQLYHYNGASVEILCSLDDIICPYTFPSPNEMSLAFRVEFNGGDKKAVLLTDCMASACRQLAFTYGDYLKADIMQTAHHGLIGGDLYLYKIIDPDICCWDCSESRFNGENEKSYKWCLGEGGCDYNAWLRNENIKKRKHYTNSKTNVIVF